MLEEKWGQKGTQGGDTGRTEVGRVGGSGSSGDDSGGDGGPSAHSTAEQGDGDTNEKGSQMVEGKVKVFYCKWNGELGEKGRWEKERKYDGELSVVTSSTETNLKRG